MLQREQVLLFDVGVRNALLGIHRRPLSIDQIGTVFEKGVTLQIVHLNHVLKKGWTLPSYRSEGGAEVDLVIDTADGPIGIEIKAGRSIAKSDLRGLVSLADLVRRPRALRRWIVYRGTRRQRFPDGAEAWPVLEAIRALAEMPAS